MVEKSAPVSVENDQKVSILDKSSAKKLLRYSLNRLFHQVLVISWPPRF